MSTITFRGAFIRSADLHTEDGGTVMRLHMSADITNAPYNNSAYILMHWDPIAKSLDAGKLNGHVHALNIVLKPVYPDLSMHEIVIGEANLSHFQFVRDAETNQIELRFVISSSEPGVIVQVENYIRPVGKAPGLVKIRFNEQTELPFEAGDQTDENNTDDPPLDGASAPPIITESVEWGGTEFRWTPGSDPRGARPSLPRTPRPKRSKRGGGDEQPRPS